VYRIKIVLQMIAVEAIQNEVNLLMTQKFLFNP